MPLKYEVKISNRTARFLQLMFPQSQYQHVLELLLRLADFKTPLVVDLDIEKISNWVMDAYVLRDKGGPLRKNKVQLVFFVDDYSREISVIRGYKGWTRYFDEDQMEKIETIYVTQMIHGNRISRSVKFFLLDLAREVERKEAARKEAARKQAAARKDNNKQNRGSN